jgi:signal transduction histidine kinase/DNA-binding response OmpR family regulator
MKNLHWESLKFRYAVLFSFFIAIILIFNAGLLIYFKYKEFQNDIEQRAFSFGNLAVKPISDGYDTYYYSGYFKFRELMNGLMDSEQDLTKILLLDVNGRILFDSDDLKKSHFIPRTDMQLPVITDAYYLDSIRKLDISQRYITDDQGERTLEIVSPYIEEWGRHKLSVILHFSYHSLYPQIKIMVYQVVGLTLLSMLFTSFLAWIVTGKITEPLDRLTEQARSMIHGSFEETELETSKNEIQLLTNTFNLMTSRLQENIKQLEENNVKLGNLNEELKELDRLKSDLLANVSHELRTPLTSIKGYTEYILERKLGPITQKQEKGLMVVQRNLDRLSKLINALLDYSLMDAEKMVLTIKPFNLKLLSKQVVVNLGSELEKRSVQFKIDIPDDLPLVVGDKDKIYQVLENLTINAIKFTESGGTITIGARTVAQNDETMVRINVSDTGIGIPEPALQRIFERFYQVDGTSKRRYGGMGLGLAIAKSIIDAHKGQVEVDSKVGHGTTFTITLPALSEILIEHEDWLMRKDNGDNYMIEIIDDDPDILRLLRMYLEDEGFRVITAENAEHGLALANQHRPDAIILDVLLPDQHGFNLLETLKSQPHTAMIPVLILSIIKEKLKGMSLGAAEYLVKPVGHTLLKATLQKILGKASSASKTILIVDDEEDTLQFLKERLNEEGFKTIEASNGKVALEKAAENRPDLILLDIMMPEITGWDVMEQLQKKEDTASIPIVVLSAATSETDKQRGFRMGIRQYLTKPVEIKNLISEIKKVVQNRETQDA